MASSFACSATAGLAGLAEARRDHDERLHALAPAVLHHALHEVARDDDHGEIHLVGDVLDARVGAHRLDGLRLRVHRIDGAGEGVREEVVEDLPADGAALAAGADHGDGAGGEERVQVQHGAGYPAAGNAPSTHGDPLGLHTGSVRRRGLVIDEAKYKKNKRPFSSRDTVLLGS